LGNLLKTSKNPIKIFWSKDEAERYRLKLSAQSETGQRYKTEWHNPNPGVEPRGWGIFEIKEE